MFEEALTQTGIHKDTFYKNGITKGSSDLEITSFLKERTKASGRFTQETADKVVSFLSNLSESESEPNQGVQPKPIQKPIQEPKPKPIPIPKQRTESETESKPKQRIETEKETGKESESESNQFISFLCGDVFLSCVFLVGAFAQVFHTVRFAKICVVGSGELEAWVFAVAIDLTAFTLSIRKGKDYFLFGSLFAHTAINLTYYYSTTGIGIANGLLSVLMALAIFSYSELITKSNK